MNRITVIISIRLLAIYSFVQSYSSLIPSFLVNYDFQSWQMHLQAIFFVSIVPILLWVMAPRFAKYHSVDEGSKESDCELLSIGIFLLGIYWLPEGLIVVFGAIIELISSGEDITISELWQYKASLRRTMLFGITKLTFALLCMLRFKRIVSLYHKFGNNCG